MADSLEKIKGKFDSSNLKKIEKIKNKALESFLVKFVSLLDPDNVFVCDDSAENMQFIRDYAIEKGEEGDLAIEGHTYHFDGINDQARDKKRTKFLVPKDAKFGSGLNTIDKDEGLSEIMDIMDGIMTGKTLFVMFFTLGPNDSVFTIPAVQLTDSSYVAHSETILYRPGYDEFVKRGENKDFFKFVHSAGELENMVSKNVDKRRVFIDVQENIVYSANTQYGGNTIGLKKLAMRLGINKAAKEGWLTEHMFISGIKGPGGRTTYFAGAFPSMCGKTSTAMIPNETIIGDDIVYIREIDGEAKAVNVEKGLFGIIQDINDKDDTIIWDVLNNPNEVIFSNILVTEDKKVHWIGKPGELPEKGINFAGEWWPGKTDSEGNEIPPSHKNARFTTSIASLSNRDERYNDPAGVPLSGLIYGGRDSDTWVPVFEAYDWLHGIAAVGASLESETTAATLGKTGVRTFNPMSNLDFLSIPFGEYVKINMDFGKKLTDPPKIFGVNYFLKGKDGEFLNSKLDKRVWLKWAELRTHDEVDAIDIGIGLIPEYEDLKRLFKEVLDADYSKEDYVEQFTLRSDENISKIDRIIKTYKGFEEGAPKELFEVLEAQKKRLEKIRSEKGKYVSPEDF